MKVKEILSAYRAIEDAEPDISTERLLQMTADRCRVNVDDVVVALYCEYGQGEKEEGGDGDARKIKGTTGVGIPAVKSGY